MADTTRLSVGAALDKLRGANAPASKMNQLNANIEAVDQEIQHLRATRRQLERDQRTPSNGSTAQEAAVRGFAKVSVLVIMIGTVIGVEVDVIASPAVHQPVTNAELRLRNSLVSDRTTRSLISVKDLFRDSATGLAPGRLARLVT